MCRILNSATEWLGSIFQVLEGIVLVEVAADEVMMRISFSSFGICDFVGSCISWLAQLPETDADLFGKELRLFPRC